MSKLCQCKLEKLEKRYWKHVEECTLMDCVYEGNMILIQDCVCEKKEKRTPIGKCLHGCDLSDLCLYCEYDRKYRKYECKHGVVFQGTVETICNYCLEKEKQSQSPCTCDSAFYINSSGVHRPDCIANTNQQKVQSPCEHKYFQELIICGDLISAKRVHFPNTPTIFYLCYKCGLVTCKNPNK